MSGILAMQSGPGRAVRDGSLGSDLQAGPGRAFRDGVLGGAMQTGAGTAYREGSLGCTSGCGGEMATGPGGAYRDGSLGSTVELIRGDKKRRGNAARSKVMSGLSGVGLTMDLIIGAGVGAAAVYFLVGKKKG